MYCNLYTHRADSFVHTLRLFPIVVPLSTTYARRTREKRHQHDVLWLRTKEGNAKNGKQTYYEWTSTHNIPTYINDDMHILVHKCAYAMSMYTCVCVAVWLCLCNYVHERDGIFPCKAAATLFICTTNRVSKRMSKLEYERTRANERTHDGTNRSVTQFSPVSKNSFFV